MRCDRAAPSCRNCLRLGVRCPGYDGDDSAVSRGELVSSVEGIYRAAGVERRRIGSCIECRKTKSRCTRTRPTCQRCQQRTLACTYPSRSERERLSQPAPFDNARPRDTSPTAANTSEPSTTNHGRHQWYSHPPSWLMLSGSDSVIDFLLQGYLTPLYLKIQNCSDSWLICTSSEHIEKHVLASSTNPHSCRLLIEEL